MSNDTHPFIRRAALGACAAALAALVVPSTTAHAATARPAVTLAKPGSGATVLTLTVPATRAGAAPQTINCTVTPSTPFRYYGGPYGGGEEGLASVSCTAPVYKIQLGVALYYNGSQVTYNSTTVYNALSSSADTEYPLNHGTYQTGAQATITTAYGGTPVTSPVYGSSTVTLP
ncbi:hypothetical protein [Streptomyces sp. CB01881]|uniref:hypothetical protein n=1 Tax=Streptomyces sp. CB01881 TaxID=2078691 RepID=UPI000CDC7FE2|nr:hypothetical protein [Streptomyces sp. CB01881]AUY52657.1 hypothetical protein C2142_31325 [Streptomyces sp. CB01881]TYC70375.1 hypothetical protein EH183_31390 [Streptomyces sp. CB01881]